MGSGGTSRCGSFHCLLLGLEWQSSVAASDSVAASAIDSTQGVQIDFSASEVQWKGFKPTGSHYGKLPVSSGQLDLREGILRGGYVALRLDSLTVEDPQARGRR